MKTNFKSTVVAIALAGMSLGVTSPVLAQNAQPGAKPGGCDMPEASLCYWPRQPVESMRAGTLTLVEDWSSLGQPIVNHPAVHLSGAEQLVRAGQTFVPEAGLYLTGHVHQESGASQLTRVYGPNAFIPEAALYLGEWMPRVAVAGPQD